MQLGGSWRATKAAITENRSLECEKWRVDKIATNVIVGSILTERTWMTAKSCRGNLHRGGASQEFPVRLYLSGVLGPAYTYNDPVLGSRSRKCRHWLISVMGFRSCCSLFAASCASWHACVPSSSLSHGSQITYMKQADILCQRRRWFLHIAWSLTIEEK